jgi:Outer membrane protein beta-barrel domain
MKTKILLLLMPFLINAQETTKTEIVNPKGKWYFGAELGLNTITSYTLNEPNKSFQGGVVAEYYTGRHWSLSTKIKYLETGVSFHLPYVYEEGGGGNFNIFSFNKPNYVFGEFNGQFKAAIISIPICIKWEYRIFKNLGGSLKFGYAVNFETKSNYTNYSQNLESNYPKNYCSTITGFGFNYFIKPKTAIYIDFETHRGGVKAKFPNYVKVNDQNTINQIVNFGIKHNFKK